MNDVGVVFDGVWKKFRRGDLHDSLRDLIPALVGRARGRRSSAGLEAQEFWALADVSFEVNAGQAFGIIGRNGAGKSTALKVLTRILRPARGYCEVRGRVGALIEVAAGFHPDLTGRENIYLQGAIMGMRRAEIARKLDAIIEFAGVEQFIDTPVKRYSSGMNARLGFSIAAHLDPDVLIIDEVLSVGDLPFQQKCQQRMQEFRDRGVAIVFVSHNLDAVLRLCSRALCLENGRVVCVGPTTDVVNAYAASGQRAERDASLQGDGVAVTVRFPEDGSGGVWSLQPGARIRAEVEIEFQEAIRRAGIGFLVRDMIRNVQVYGATSETIGMHPISGRPGDRRTFEFSLETNLTQGLYGIEINLFDSDRHKQLATIRPVKQFSITDSTSDNGVANLFLRGAERSEPES